MRHCGIYACPRVHENRCCADCKEDCANRCLNGPERCHCTIETASKAKQLTPERIRKNQITYRQQIFRYLDAGCDTDFIEAKGFRRKYITQVRHDWRIARANAPVLKIALVRGLMDAGLSDLDILAYGWDTKIVETCRKEFDPGET